MEPKISSIKKNNKEPLRIITMSGTVGVTKNLILYECDGSIIVVDVGIGFPDSEMPGVDVVIPDFSYLLENRERVKGIFITHCHEDHFGATPYLLKELNVPVYCSKLVQGHLKERLEDRVSKSLLESVSFNILSPDTPEVKIDKFSISAFGVNHSVPGSMGFAIRTPQGLVLHISDFRIDWTPVLDKPIDLATIAKLGEEGVLCLLSDCLGADTEGYSHSEKTLDNTFGELFGNIGDRQILVTTISTNLSRMHQIISSAIKVNRKVVLCGRSIQKSVKIARSLGYLEFDENVFVLDKHAKKHLQKDLVYLIAGCYGQPNSSLARVGRGEHRNVEIEKDALVVFSADPNPPGTREDVEKVMDQIVLRGAEVIYSKIQENLHVSGHGPRGDLMTIASVVKPKYFIPIGGTVTKMRAYSNMIGSLGHEKGSVFELLEGESVVFDNGVASKGESVEVRQVLVEGVNYEEVKPAVVRDREVLSNDGVFVVIVPIDKKSKKIVGKVDVVSRGFVYVKESGELVGGAKNVINSVMGGGSNGVENWGQIKVKLEKEVEKFLRKKTGRRPMVLVHGIYV